MNNPLIPIILCGGSGSRLWPLSRDSYPKQYLSLDSGNFTLLQQTEQRLIGLDNLENPIIVCNNDHRFIVAEQMREININPLSILLEPVGKNTAPAITIAALNALETFKDPTLIVLSSDHKINNKANFHKAIKVGLKHAEKSKLVTFGVVPDSPQTGYGYIKAGKFFSSDINQGGDIAEFIEKPNFEKAKILFKNKKYTWNSGIFLFKAKTFLSEIERFCPSLLENCKLSLNKSKFDLDFRRLDKESFYKCDNISVDIAIMEKTKKGVVIPLDAGWSDIGSWKSVWETSEKNLDGNVIRGNVIIKNSKNSYIRSEHRLVVGIGLEDLIVTETNDALLIINKDKSQEVKDIVSDLKERKIPEGQKHKKIYRPWGNYQSIIDDKNWQVKLIEVKPNQALSLQMHHYRSEHWIVVKGIAKVEIDNKVIYLNENESTYIPQKSKHRLSNPKDKILTIIEVQIGTYLGEDDIIRFEDKYGRPTK
tara:strand:- start:1167 stop:2603 length:1437 start_codon:yes stop_codon:yes gene_type:complete